jgi:hypothetical protein
VQNFDGHSIVRGGRFSLPEGRARAIFQKAGPEPGACTSRA